MGNGMNKIVPGLYLGSIKDSSDAKQLETNKITHILAIHDHPKSETREDLKYLRFNARDNAQQDIKQFFDEAIDFIHEARINNGNVLVHCLAGVSRSASLVIAYLMTITEMPWYDSMNVVRGAREQAGPNFGFQRQLQNFDHTSVKLVREKLFSKHGVYDNSADLIICSELLLNYKQTQAKFEAITDKSSLNTNSFTKTYPLAYNAYNLDEESKQKKKNKSRKPSNSSADDRKAKDKEEIGQDSPETFENEKEEIVKKIFG